MRPKYGNKKVEIDGIVFDSKREAKRYSELKLLQRAGEISNLETQKAFELIPAYPKVQRSVKYIADFVYNDIDGNVIVEDVKWGKPGSKSHDAYKKTPAYQVFNLKRKMMYDVYRIIVVEV